jgi:hypothetical protein
VIDCHLSFPQWSEENIGGGHGILNREVNTDPTHRRHGVRGIANAQQTRPKPL